MNSRLKLYEKNELIQEHTVNVIVYWVRKNCVMLACSLKKIYLWNSQPLVYSQRMSFLTYCISRQAVALSSPLMTFMTSN